MRRSLVSLARSLVKCGKRTIPCDLKSISFATSERFSSRFLTQPNNALCSRHVAAFSAFSSLPSTSSPSSSSLATAFHQRSYFFHQTSSSFSTTPAPPSDSESSTIEVTSVAEFNSVVELSNTVPVIIDCYAQWCGPCKALDPVLKQVVAAEAGKVALAKVDIDAPGVASLMQQLQVSSVPTLFMLFGGRVIDVKQGAPPQAQLREWVAKGVELADAVAGAAGVKQEQQQETGEEGAPPSVDPKTLVEDAFAAARAPGAAAHVERIAPQFAAAMQSPAAPAEVRAAATAGLALCAALDGDFSTAKELLGSAKAAVAAGGSDQQPPPDAAAAVAADVPVVSAVEAIVGLVEESSQLPPEDTCSIAALQQKILDDPNNSEAIYALALRLFTSGQREEAVDAALLLVRRGREWREQAGRRLTCSIADAMGPWEGEAAKSARRRLSNVWFI